MNTYKILVVLNLLLCTLYYSCEECQEVLSEPCGEAVITNSEYCGWTISTCFARTEDNDIGVIYDTRFNADTPTGEDWGTTITSIHPSNWTRKEIGQIFGIATDLDDNIYLASSDIYMFDNNWPNLNLPSSNSDRPNTCGRIFKCQASDNWEAESFVDLPNNCDPFNGIGNIVFDNRHEQLFASNLEDGKIYRISKDAEILETFDPWNIDNGVPGIVEQEERVWGIGVNVENGITKIYFAKSSIVNSLYSVSLDENGAFITTSEKLEISELHGDQPLISDICFNNDHNIILLSERGNPHSSEVYSYKLNNDNWNLFKVYHIGGATTTPNSQNGAGGIDFGYENDIENVSAACQTNFWASGNIMRTRSIDKIYGITNIQTDGNSPGDTPSPGANMDTDLFIDYNGVYTFSDKETPGDVEVLDCSACGDPCSLNDYN